MSADIKTDADLAFAAGRKAYSLQSPRALFASRDLFRTAAKLSPDMAQARAALAYTLCQSWLQGWSGEDALTEAADQAEEAMRLDPGEASVNSFSGFVYLCRGHFERSLALYRRAVTLPGASPETSGDRAEAEIYAGEIDTGIDILSGLVLGKDSVPDWQRWDLAWAWFLKGQENPAGDQLALDQMDLFKAGVDDPAYLVDCLLMRAVLETRLDQGEAAQADLERFLARRTDWTLWREKRSVHFKRMKDEIYWLEACKAAGLPG